MRRLILTGLIVLLEITTTLAEEPSKALVKHLAEKVAKATIEGDAETVVDQTYPSLVKLIGGRKTMIDFTRKSLQELRDQGVVIKKFEVEEPGKFYIEGNHTFTIVPTKFEMIVSEKTIAGQSYLLAISSDAGKSWTFLDGNGMKDTQFRKKILPKLPAKLVLPEIGDPVILKEKS